MAMMLDRLTREDNQNWSEEVDHDIRTEAAGDEQPEGGGPPFWRKVPGNKDHAGDEHQGTKDAANFKDFLLSHPQIRWFSLM